MRRGSGSVLAVLVMAACGAASGPPITASDDREANRARVEQLADRLAALATAHDHAGIAALLAPEVGYGGAWFTDPACQRQLSSAGQIPIAARERFAECLATLPLTRATHAGPSMVLYEYAPGILLEAKFDPGDGGHLTYIGYAGRRGVRDPLPVITHAALIAHRHPAPPLVIDEATRKEITRETARRREQIQTGRRVIAPAGMVPSPLVWSWIKVCVDATGTVTSARARNTVSVAVSRALMAWVRTWTFEPITLGGHPSPVCAHVFFDADAPSTTDLPAFPAPVPIELGDSVVIPIGALGKLQAGTMTITPSPDEMTMIKRHHLSPVIASVYACVDETGTVTRSQIIRSSRLRAYDRLLRASVLQWRFAPYVVLGTAEPVCAVAMFVYRQR